MSKDLSPICLGALKEVKAFLDVSGNTLRETIETFKDEPVTKSDLEISRILKESFLNSGLNAVYSSEEVGVINPNVKNPEYSIFWDELDGTFNFQRGGILPYTTVISAFENTGNGLRFRDAIFGAVFDLKEGNLWYAKRGKGCFLNGNRTYTSQRKDLGKACFSMVDFGPCPSVEQLTKLIPVYSSTWTHNVSSAGFHLAGVASGHFDAYVCLIQKAHELGAGNLLIKEAGGIVLGPSGNPIDNQQFDFNRKYPIIAAATPELAVNLTSLITENPHT